MDIGDMLDKAKDAAQNVSDSQIEQARDFVDEKVDDKFDGALDAVANQAQKVND
ncbi:MAG TPA: hypothetical protein VFD20_03495 [Demequina sp.]|nr:hypothetical protein [Demequina sp.]